MTKAVVLLSGGQDSVTILGLAIKNGFECFALGFDYGQRHKVELSQAKKIADTLEVPYRVIDIRSFGELVTSALSGTGSFGVPHARMQGVPSSFVPNRNALLLTLAHAYAQEVGAEVVFGGMCQTDYSGYPDCRRAFIEGMQNVLNHGYQTHIQFVTPLMWLTKAETFKMAEESGVLELVVSESHTCYEGNHDDFHEWGYGCGKCPACLLRAKGWEEYKQMGQLA